MPDIHPSISDLAPPNSTGTGLCATTSMPGLMPPRTGNAGDVLKGDGTWGPGGGGSDPWTYVRLASDFPTSLIVAQNVSGLAFTPGANKRYEVYGSFLLRTATATVGPRTGIAWPAGMTDGVATVRVTSAAGTQVMANGNIGAAVLAPAGGLPNTTQSWPGDLDASLIAGAVPVGSFQVQLASETAGTTVTMKAGSWIAYREIP